MAMNILVVDDDLSTLTALERVLTWEGHTVDGCNSGEAALERLASQTYDVLLTDLIMPKVSGRQLVEAASRLERAPRCFIMSGMPQEDDTDASFIRKPLNVEELLRKLTD